MKIKQSGIPALLIIATALFFYFFISDRSYTQSQKNENVQISTSTSVKEVIYDENNDIKEVIIDYYRLSKNGNFSELRDLVTKATDRKISSTNKEKKMGVSSNVDFEKNTETTIDLPDLMPISDFLYEFTVDEIPNSIYEGQWEIQKVQNINVEKDKATAEVTYRSRGENSQLIKQNFYLVRKDNKWKIFQVKYVQGR